MMYPKTWATGLLVMAVPVALFGAGFLVGQQVESSAASKEKLVLHANHIKQLDEAFADYKTKLEEQRKLNEEVISEYLDEKDEIERKHRELSRTRSLRLPRAVCDSGPVPAAAPGEPRVVEATAATVALPERVTEDLRRLVERADEVTAQCRGLIAYVER